jgi:hypothetical protein
MKLMPKSTLARCLWVGAIIGLIALTGPSLIHFAYRVATPLATKQAQTERYQDLAKAEAFDRSLSEEQRMRMREERLKLFYWFHSRGWNIDEDDEDRSWLQPWRELIQHWTNHRGANNALVPAAGAALPSSSTASHSQSAASTSARNVSSYSTATRLARHSSVSSDSRHGMRRAARSSLSL